MAASELTLAEVRKFIFDNGGKIANRELVKHFQKFLNSEQRQAEMRAKFKDIINSIATMKQEDGVKYVVLKKNKSQSSLNGCETPTSTPMDFTTHGTLVHSHTDPGLLTRGVESSTAGPCWSTDLPPGHTPQPPPRRKNSGRGKENRGAKYEESLKQLNEEKETQELQRQEEIKEIVSPGSVKERAQKLNRMASELDLSQKCSLNGLLHGSGRRRDARHEKAHDDDDACSVSTMDPRRKEWILKSSQADYHGLSGLLREEPGLANCKDFNNYTALHWAAKRGNLDVIKLIAGAHKVDPNARTSGGYTPLHLAAMHGREEIMEILMNTYGADSQIRDNNGKRAVQHLSKTQASRFMSLFPHCSRSLSIHSEKDLGFHRIGSLKESKGKKSTMFAGGKALTRMKSWGSADNIPERNLMPPPKFFPKRKKSRKQMDYFGSLDNGKSKSGDSDSDSTPSMSTT